MNNLCGNNNWRVSRNSAKSVSVDKDLTEIISTSIENLRSKMSNIFPLLFIITIDKRWALIV